MKYIKKFNESSVDDKSIEDWCREFKLSDYTINSDNSIDANGKVSLWCKRLNKIPIQFGIVNGNFYCGENYLSNLKGCPKYVSQCFDCNDNKIETLEHCPIKIGETFACQYNLLTTLVYGPKEVGNNYFCEDNKLLTLVGSPNKININFYCSRNSLTNLIGGPKNVSGDYYCRDNNLTTLEGLPESLGGQLFFGYNPICEIYKLFEFNYKYFIDSLDYNYLRGTNIIKLRLQEALEEIGIMKVPDSIPRYKYI